ncbi:hypothetical protein E1211_22635 [Micromonospora sp. 15K316]|uniref:hypothetical protein n=1 Tax=Micromonospora sp. 15K316 TaxID=2530376 RepID=UPI00104E499F|nr:hypothetical protein [Micromonospora sp. 15K316]TDC31383.1 hypothetical protein E1211_22635 [Micromonospora sp. 15K316]
MAGTSGNITRLSTVWGEIGPVVLSGTDLTYPINTGTILPGASFTAPEPGVYAISAKISAQVRHSAPNPAPHLNEMSATVRRNGTGLATGYVLGDYWYDTTGTIRLYTSGTATLSPRVQLAAGDLIEIAFGWWATGTVAGPDGSHGSFTINANVGYDKISD